MSGATRVPAADGYPVAVTVTEPAGPARATVLLAGAMGATQRYYRAFSAWLASEGFRAVTFDPRGIGESAPRSLRGFPASVSDWIQLDYAAAAGVAARLAGERPLIWLGHSLGAQVLPLVPGADRVTRLVMVASGTGWWRLHDTPMKLRAALLWFGVARPAIAAAGYFPGRMLRMVGDLPAGVMLQWRRWCLHPRYAASEPGADAAYAAFTKPVTSLSFTDDEFMSARNTAALHALYGAAPLHALRVAPHELGVPMIGHFGLFRASVGGTAWRTHLLPLLE